MTTVQDTLRHLVASLTFRFQHVTEDAPSSFGDFVAGAEVRTPRDIVKHMTGLVGLVHEQFVAFERERLEPLPWAEEKVRFLDALALVDADFAGGTLREDAALGLERILQGPLTDVATHIGQLATLRRLAGSPVVRVSYIAAEMRVPQEHQGEVS